MNKFLLLINDLNEIEYYKKLGINNFAIGLKNYSVFTSKSYDLKDIIKIDNVFIFINKILNNREVNDIKNMFKIVPKNIKGVIISDLGLFNFFNEKKIDVILNLRHFGTNYESVNNFLNLGFKSYILSNEITKEEIKKITDNTIKPVIIEVLSHNIVSYSKRKLISNYNEYYNENVENNIIINDKISNSNFIVNEQPAGTIFATSEIYDARELLNLNNILYFFINSSFIKKEIIEKFLTNKNIENSNKGFLNKETIYKVKGE